MISRIATSPIEGDLIATNVKSSRRTREGYSSSDQAQQNQAGGSGPQLIG